MNVSKTLRIATAAVAVLAAGAASAQVHPWTSVGSAGTVDEADTGIVEFVLGEARVRAAAPAGSLLNLRYNVVSLPGFAGLGQYLMRVRFRDNGAGANVRLDLRRHNINGVPGTVHSFNSDAFPAAVGYQTRQQCIGINWDFVNNGYYIDAGLTKSGNAGTPALAVIQLIPSNCTP